jgi:hypothetical protein
VAWVRLSARRSRQWPIRKWDVGEGFYGPPVQCLSGALGGCRCLGRGSTARVLPYIGSTTNPSRAQGSHLAGTPAGSREFSITTLTDSTLAGNVFLISSGHSGLPVVALMDEYPVAK